MFSKVAESAQKMTFFYVGIMIVLASVVAQRILLVYAELAYHNCKCHWMERIESHAVCILFVLCMDFVHVHTCFLSLPHPFMRWCSLQVRCKSYFCLVVPVWSCSVSHETHETETLCGTLISSGAHGRLSMVVRGSSTLAPLHHHRPMLKYVPEP